MKKKNWVPKAAKNVFAIFSNFHINVTTILKCYNFVHYKVKMITCVKNYPI